MTLCALRFSKKNSYSLQYLQILKLRTRTLDVIILAHFQNTQKFV